MSWAKYFLGNWIAILFLILFFLFFFASMSKLVKYAWQEIQAEYKRRCEVREQKRLVQILEKSTESMKEARKVLKCGLRNDKKCD